MTAYIEEQMDRELDVFWEVDVVEDDEIIESFSGYDRESLVAEVEEKYPEVEWEQA